MEIKRCYETIIGASVGENQLVQSGDTSVTVPNGHKYYSKINGTETLGASTGTAIAINDSAKDMVTDLTQKLGSAIADYVYGLGTSSGIAKLREWGFLKGYQAYNAGAIESVEVTGKVVRGFNQWDEVWENGVVISDGTISSASAYASRRTSSFIPVIPNTSYYLKCPNNALFGRYAYYDANKNLVAYNESGFDSHTPSATPSNAWYLRITFGSGYGTTYNHDICINLSNPDRNGEYEAYVSQSYDYGDDTLRGIFKLDANNNLYADGDRKTSDGVITRKYNYLLLNGDESWILQSINEHGIANFLLGVDEYGDFKNSRCNRFALQTSSIASTTDEGYLFSANQYLYIRISSSKASTDAEFKTWLAANHTEIIYELATPTTEQSTPFPSPQVCYPDGTEEYVTSNGVPVGHETRYEL